jgi:DNA polymerase III delta prime subunit|tara:strand:+ start:245 stop:1180 length:936 start_codon:yes stop_codon:yes gene_type:complete
MQEHLWVEKYRPSTLQDIILPSQLKKDFELIVKQRELQNMLLTGTAGTGKTTVAKALCKMLNLDYIIINGSEESGIDTLRNKIKQFASSVSLEGGYKVVILDEADYLNPQSTQPALRGFIEEFSANCRFILTCNFKNRIIEPLHSRCSVVEFAIPKGQKQVMAAKMMERLGYILTNEGVSYEEPVLAELIMKYFPDFRRTINELQRYGVSGKIDSGILINVNDVSVGHLMNHLKVKDFRKMRQWVADNIDIEPAAMFRKIYDSSTEYIDPQSIPQLILILADYQYKDSFVADHELNMVACLTEIMAGVQFK